MSWGQHGLVGAHSRAVAVPIAFKGVDLDVPPSVAQLLPLTLQTRARGDWAGCFDGFGTDGQLEGWVCSLPLSAHPQPLEVELWLEDLLVPGSALLLGRCLADEARPDLQAADLPTACGFELRGPLRGFTVGTRMMPLRWLHPLVKQARLGHPAA